MMKVLVEGQTIQRMVGYCNNDANMVHFRSRSKGVSDAMRAAGIAEHVSLRLSFLDDKIVQNKSNMFIKTHNFWLNNYPDDTNIEFAQVQADMHNQGKHIISPLVLMNGNGQMREAAAETYWALLIDKGTAATAQDMRRILYLPNPNSWKSPLHHYIPPEADATPARPTEPQPMSDYEPLETGSKYDNIKNYLAWSRNQQKRTSEQAFAETEHESDGHDSGDCSDDELAEDNDAGVSGRASDESDDEESDDADSAA